jgi:CelD/BcsL family acetyltransferase involved in cellulose biosynthesis
VEVLILWRKFEEDMDNKQLSQFLNWQYVEHEALGIAKRLKELSNSKEPYAGRARNLLLMAKEIALLAGRAAKQFQPCQTVLVVETTPSGLTPSAPPGSAAVEEDSEIFLVSRRGQAGTEEYPLKGELLD